MSDVDPAPEPTPAVADAAPAAAPAPVEPAAVDPAPAEPAADAAPESNWRTEYAGDDAKKLAQLERYATQNDAFDALFAAKQKISSGELEPVLGDEPSEDQIAAYREANGIPESYDKYEIKMEDGFTFGEEDQPFIDVYFEKMHGKHASPEQVNAGLAAYREILEQQALQYQERDKNDKEQMEDQLRATYGAEYRANHNMVQNFLGTAPTEVQNMVTHGRGPDGKALMNDASFVNWLNNIVREINPAASVLPSGNTSVEGVTSELATLKAEMDSDYNAWTAPGNSAKRGRYSELLAAQEKIDKRKG